MGTISKADILERLPELGLLKPDLESYQNVFSSAPEDSFSYERAQELIDRVLDTLDSDGQTEAHITPEQLDPETYKVKKDPVFNVEEIRSVVLRAEGHIGQKFMTAVDAQKNESGQVSETGLLSAFSHVNNNPFPVSQGELREGYEDSLEVIEQAVRSVIPDIQLRR